MLAKMKSMRQVSAGEVCIAPIVAYCQAGRIRIAHSPAVAMAETSRSSHGSRPGSASQIRSTFTRSPVR